MMKNIFVGVLIVLFSEGILYGQSVQYGITGGVNLSTLRLTEEPHTDDLGTYEPGLLAGIHRESNLKGNLNLLIQGLVTYKRTSRTSPTYEFQSDGETFRINMTDRISAFTVDVPVLLKYEIPWEVNLPVHLLGGAYVNSVFYVKRSLILKDANSSEEESESANITPDVTGPVDVGFIGGIGLSIGEKYLITARYNHGLTNYYNDPSYFENGTLKGRFFSFQLIYYL